MSDCKIRAWSVPDKTAPGIHLAAARCDAHDWNFGVGGCQSGMCPVGHLQKAFEASVTAIVKATKEANNATA